MSYTRRGLLRGTAAGGAAALGLATTAGAATDVIPLLHGAHTDAQVLLQLLDFEQIQEFAYAHVLRGAALQPTVRSTLTRFLSQERRHAELLASELVKRHVAVPAPPSSVAEADGKLAAVGVSGQLDRFHQETPSVHLLIAIETAAEQLYYAAIETLSSTDLVGLAADILGCEAQHWTGLSAVLHHNDPGLATPRAFAPLVGQLANP